MTLGSCRLIMQMGLRFQTSYSTIRTMSTYSCSRPTSMKFVKSKSTSNAVVYKTCFEYQEEWKLAPVILGLYIFEEGFTTQDVQSKTAVIKFAHYVESSDQHTVIVGYVVDGYDIQEKYIEIDHTLLGHQLLGFSFDFNTADSIYTFELKASKYLNLLLYFLHPCEIIRIKTYLSSTSRWKFYNCK